MIICLVKVGDGMIYFFWKVLVKGWNFIFCSYCGWKKEERVFFFWGFDIVYEEISFLFN